MKWILPVTPAQPPSATLATPETWKARRDTHVPVPVRVAACHAVLCSRISHTGTGRAKHLTTLL